MKRLKDVDSADSIHRFKLVFLSSGWLLILLLFVEMLLLHQRRYLLCVILIVLYPVCCIALASMVGVGLDALGSGFIRMLHSSGGEGHRPDYSEIEALIVAGHFAQAADSYRAVIDDAPELIEPRLRLAALLTREMNDPVGAEACYLAARARGLPPRHETAVTNGLIDLYRATGNREQLKAELARFARMHRNTPAGEDARTYLRKLASEDRLPH